MILDSTYIATLIGLFIILSPGLLLTLPTLSLDDLTKKGISYLDSGDATQCVAFDDGASCQKAHDFWASGYTTTAAVIVHALVFGVVLYMVPQYVGLRSFDTTTIAAFSVLFAVLSPGLILTLPGLSKIDCGEGHKNVADGTSFCDAIANITTAEPKCHTCTSWFASGHTNVVPVVVHSLVFGALAFFIAKNYL